MPPAEKNGSVTPITGKIERHIPRFIKICAKNIAKTPAHNNVPCKSRARFPINKILAQTAAKRPITNKQPKSPSSSPMLTKIKSF